MSTIKSIVYRIVRIKILSVLVILSHVSWGQTSTSNIDELKEIRIQLKLCKANSAAQIEQLQNRIQAMNSSSSSQFADTKVLQQELREKQLIIDSLSRRVENLQDDLIRTSNALDDTQRLKKTNQKVVSMGSMTVSGSEDPKQTYSIYTPRIRASQGKAYHSGPRGGCYYLTASGRKQYVDRSLCN